MEPRIQYAKTNDGVSIAYWTLGEGMPFVILPSIPWSHVEKEWQVSEWRALYQRLAENRMLIRYDNRGSGLSDRDVTDYSLEGHVLDLEAVVNRLGLSRVALFGSFGSGPMAIAYAARHPERVSHLILQSTYARVSDVRTPRIRSLLALVDKDWDLYTETTARVLFGWTDEEQARHIAALMRESATPEAVLATVQATEKLDVTPLLPQVRASTLVVHVREYRIPDLDLARSLAAHIEEARLAIVDNLEAIWPSVDEFLGEGEEAAAGAAEPPEAGAFRTILFTDMEGSTGLTQRLGDAKAQEVLRIHNSGRP